MANFRFSFDVGAGWVVYTAYENNVTWGNFNEINPAIVRVRLTGGSVIFAGAEYTALINFKDSGEDYVPILVEQDNAGWNTIFEGNADLRNAWDENRSLITLSKFNNGADVYDNLLSNYTTKYPINELGLTTHRIVTPTHNTTTVDATKQVTGLTPANYILAYDINGFPSTVGFPDLRWNYFLFRSTDAGGHNFETMAYFYEVDADWLYTEIRILLNSVYTAIWCKLPTAIGSSESRNPAVAFAFSRFPDYINALLPIAVSTLTFTEATALSYAGLFDSVTPAIQYAWFDYTLYQLGEAAGVAKAPFKGSQISLKDCFDIMEEFHLYWYLDGSALKFKHASELATVGTLNLTTETTNLQRLEYINPELPDKEVWKTLDSEGVAHDTGASNAFGELQIYYRASNPILTSSIVLEHQIPLSTNVEALMGGTANVDKNNFSLIETTDDSSVPRVVYGSSGSFNSRLTAEGFFNNQSKYRFGLNPSLSTRLKVGLVALSNFALRPLFKLPIIFYHQDLLTNYDMVKAITTTAGSGITKSIKQDLNDDIAELEIII